MQDKGTNDTTMPSFCYIQKSIKFIVWMDHFMLISILATSVQYQHTNKY